jgi:predicted nucleotidyltransferase
MPESASFEPEVTPGIPSSLSEPLAKFADAFSAAAGDALSALVLYGGVARGEYHPESSDVNIMAVFKAVDVPLLDRIGPAVDQARREFELSIMVLDEADLPVCAEVFPLKFRDIERHHRLLRGRAVLGEMDITRERLQRQCLRQIQNLQLRLRQFYLQRARWPEQLEETLSDTVSAFTLDLAVLVELGTAQVPATKAAAVEAAGKLGLECGVLHELLQLKRGDLQPSPADLKRLYGGFMAVVDQAQHRLEKM